MKLRMKNLELRMGYFRDGLRFWNYQKGTTSGRL